MKKGARQYLQLLIAVFFTLSIVSPTIITSKVSALVGAHSYTNTDTGDVFLGGSYIEVGISKYGSFGTTSGEPLPAGFYGTDVRTNVGMSTNPTGFDETPDLRMDFFLPGTPEERWVVGYKIDGTSSTGSNSLLTGSTDIADYEVTDESSGTDLQANGQGTFNDNLGIQQIVSFAENNKFFKNEVTLENIGENTLDNVRYMRSFDPDNTKDQGGEYATQNQILHTFEDGDDKAVVRADTSNNETDPVFDENGSRSPIFFYSNDSRARVSTFGFANTDPYASQAYDDAKPKGTSEAGDAGMTIAVDMGSLEPGESDTFVYYTSLDNRDFDEVVEDIEEDNSNEEVDDDDGVEKDVEDAAPNEGDGNGDGVKDSEQSNVASLPNPVTGGESYKTLQTDTCESITSTSIKDVSELDEDEGYEYPLGLIDFSVDCTSSGDTVNITIYYDKKYDTSDWEARKYVDGSFISIEAASFGTATVGGNEVTTLNYNITDGGDLDADGEVNGAIVDPAGPAVKSESTDPTVPDTGLPANSYIASYLLLSVGVFGIVASTTLLYASRTQQQ